MLETSNGNPALHETLRNRLVYTQRFLKMSVVTLLLFPSLGRGGMGYSSRFSLLPLEGGGA